MLNGIRLVITTCHELQMCIEIDLCLLFIEKKIVLKSSKTCQRENERRELFGNHQDQGRNSREHGGHHG